MVVRLYCFQSMHRLGPGSRARARAEKGGIQGPPSRFMVGQIAEIQNTRSAIKDHDMESFSHDIFHRVHPALLKWRKQYAKDIGLEIVREVLSKKFSQFDKSEAGLRLANLFLDRGLVSVTGEEWSHDRRLVAPAFFHERIKQMTGAIAGCASRMLDQCEARIPRLKSLERCVSSQETLSPIQHLELAISKGREFSRYCLRKSQSYCPNSSAFPGFQASGFSHFQSTSDCGSFIRSWIL
ncbi:cytokinin hydroxylase [Selaginella moellendorffii]|uniref:cytokinin hydroxylase n=1 Tax=Selaginella moellendorffii TaxID=88036 RepID=UPI000D1CBF30|nr:cytokinin hydroxylase [Selaginella moellendorffii]|eukprot:XP_024543136.1 cytokinin hydroxylase [Selaginella moellendorffii]